MPTNTDADAELLVDVDSGTVVPAEDALDSGNETETTETATENVAAEAEAVIPLIDFSALPAPTVILALPSSPDEQPVQESLTLREDGNAAIIDLTRGGDLSQPLTVLFTESEPSAGGQPGRLSIENGGRLTFEAGQPRARMTVSTVSNSTREPDSEAVLTIRDADDTETVLGNIRMSLEDDDQRAFEAALPVNTVAFVVNQVSVREFDPAAQVEVVRYRPDNRALEVRYKLTDITATEGQDYFGPGLPLIYFAPGQRAARILIPLGQDGRPEREETFLLELEGQAIPEDSGIFSQLTVMILDDDS